MSSYDDRAARLLENKVVELGIVDRASDSTIGRTLKKTFSSPIADSSGLFPPKANSAFVAAMEDVLAVYTRPHDPDRPLLCVDDQQFLQCRVVEHGVGQQFFQPGVLALQPLQPLCFRERQLLNFIFCATHVGVSV
jgi:hypothetical protein